MFRIRIPIGLRTVHRNMRGRGGEWRSTFPAIGVGQKYASSWVCKVKCILKALREESLWQGKESSSAVKASQHYERPKDLECV